MANCATHVWCFYTHYIYGTCVSCTYITCVVIHIYVIHCKLYNCITCVSHAYYRCTTPVLHVYEFTYVIHQNTPHI